MSRRLSRLALALPPMLASCVAPPVQGPPRRPEPVTVAPPPATAPPPPIAIADNVSPGVWTYAVEPHSSTARFGLASQSAIFSIQCDLLTRSVSLLVARPRPVTGGSVSLRATSMLKTFPAEGGGAYAVVRIPARDPVLDAIAFSRGRFGVALDGVEWTLPTWPEFTRVVEDCRA
jgi:hypothetical protein